jgi:predicted AlkP superfamily phosphohydrolase/phosphomutase
MAGITRNDQRTRPALGLDGVPFSLLSDSERSVMPAAARLITAGHLHRMRASLPEISAVS